MIALVSLSPIRLTKYFWSIAFSCALISISCLAQPIFLSVGATPYDRQMRRVSPVLQASNNHQVKPIPLTSVNQWMTSLRAIPYRFSRQWKTPAEVNSAQEADCKGKAVALYAKMRAGGATHVRFVIGKHYLDDMKTHAWLEWQTAKGNYLLDPTFNWAIERAEEQSAASYVPFYVYEGPRKYRADNFSTPFATTVAQNPVVRPENFFRPVTYPASLAGPRRQSPSRVVSATGRYRDQLR